MKKWLEQLEAQILCWVQEAVEDFVPNGVVLMHSQTMQTRVPGNPTAVAEYRFVRLEFKRAEPELRKRRWGAVFYWTPEQFSKSKTRRDIVYDHIARLMIDLRAKMAA